MNEVQAIIRRWEDAGSPLCQHPRLDREYYLGTQTGDWACLDCGSDFPTPADAARDASENKKAPDLE